VLVDRLLHIPPAQQQQQQQQQQRQRVFERQNKPRVNWHC
jgi:hypothetical protein